MIEIPLENADIIYSWEIVFSPYIFCFYKLSYIIDFPSRSILMMIFSILFCYFELCQFHLIKKINK